MMKNGKTPIVRRQIIEEVSNGSFSMMLLMHMAHYDMSAKLYVEESNYLDRPIDVVNIGAGDMWDLQVLIHGMKIKKSDILSSYHGVDIVSRESPFGEKLSEEIQFTYTTKDLMEDPTLPISSKSTDVVICTEFIEHIDKDSALSILSEIQRILRKGGLLYITTPHAVNTTRTDRYHIYEWELSDLLVTLLEHRLHIEHCHGTAIDMRQFNKVNDDEQRFPKDIVNQIKHRFTPNFCRLFLSTLYPEYSTHVAIIARKM